eukprot:Sro1571_g283300.1 n/a (386) ;mRNA; r:2-1250
MMDWSERSISSSRRRRVMDASEKSVSSSARRTNTTNKMTDASEKSLSSSSRKSRFPVNSPRSPRKRRSSNRSIGAANLPILETTKGGENIKKPVKPTRSRTSTDLAKQQQSPVQPPLRRSSTNPEENSTAIPDTKASTDSLPPLTAAPPPTTTIRNATNGTPERFPNVQGASTAAEPKSSGAEQASPTATMARVTTGKMPSTTARANPAATPKPSTDQAPKAPKRVSSAATEGNKVPAPSAPAATPKPTASTAVPAPKAVSPNASPPATSSSLATAPKSNKVSASAAGVAPTKPALSAHHTRVVSAAVATTAVRQPNSQGAKNHNRASASTNEIPILQTPAARIARLIGAETHRIRAASLANEPTLAHIPTHPHLHCAKHTKTAAP